MKKVKLNKKQQQAVDLILSGVNVAMKTIGYTGDNGRFCHSSIWGRSWL